MIGEKTTASQDEEKRHNLEGCEAQGDSLRRNVDGPGGVKSLQEITAERGGGVVVRGQ